MLDWLLYELMLVLDGVLNIFVVLYDDMGLVFWLLYGGCISMLMMDWFVCGGFIYM